MKSLSELQEIRDRAYGGVSLRKEHKDGTKIVVAMGECGIAAGARSVLKAFMSELQKQNAKDVIVTQSGCIGMCMDEPVVEVFVPGKEKVTYVKMTEEKAARVVSEHIMGGNAVTEYAAVR